ncbi:MAG: DUF3800 domain-containing protein [Candidatus Moranbacteria bacterium]|nr:DUF3800 domain-containing protein [Candidatus Moranbacteria bacterium]
MLVFIDDSGDAGFKLNKGSTEYFVISAVIFDDNLEAEKTAVAIKELRRNIGFSDKVEFKFNKSKKKVRENFLQTVNKFKFRIRSLVVDKKIIRSDELKNNKDSFYSYMIKTLLKYNNTTISDASIKIDGSGDRVFRRSFVAYLRKQLNSRQTKIIKQCRLVNSKSNVLIQMADMIAGSIRRNRDTAKTDHAIYRNIIKKHIEDEWPFK